MYFNKSYKERCSREPVIVPMNYNDSVDTIVSVGSIENGISVRTSQVSKVSPCENFKNYCVNDFRLENLQAAGVQIKEMQLQPDPNFGDKLERFAQSVENAGSQIVEPVKE